MVVARKSAMATAADPARSLYLHLPRWAEAQDNGSTPFTPPVNSLLALDVALEELEQSGGWTGRRARYQKRMSRVDRALFRSDVTTMLDPADYSCVLHSYPIPGGTDYPAIHGGLKQRGFVIYAGQGSLAEQMFRISTMGDITAYDMERLLAALHAVFGG
jgi:2-aminoethylphosphonate-pyruvate transaminase